MIFKEFDNGIYYNADCFDVLKELDNNSVDMILADLPYGTTQNKWDIILPFDKLWQEYKRICNGMMVFTASEPFMSLLVTSNLSMFKYDMIWYKSQATGHLNARRRPMRAHENIAVFCNGKAKYNPVLFDKNPENIRPVGRRARSTNYGNYNETAERTIPMDKRYPQTVETFNNPNRGESGLHPTQKPVKLFEYLIKLYSNEGDVILDNCSGSGTTAIACENTNRKWICVEMDKTYYDTSIKRIDDLYQERSSSESSSDQ